MTSGAFKPVIDSDFLFWYSRQTHMKFEINYVVSLGDVYQLIVVTVVAPWGYRYIHVSSLR